LDVGGLVSGCIGFFDGRVVGLLEGLNVGGLISGCLGFFDGRVVGMLDGSGVGGLATEALCCTSAFSTHIAVHPPQKLDSQTLFASQLFESQGSVKQLYSGWQLPFKSKQYPLEHAVAEEFGLMLSSLSSSHRPNTPSSFQ
jgi:hypothetical protein